MNRTEIQTADALPRFAGLANGPVRITEIVRLWKSFGARPARGAWADMGFRKVWLDPFMADHESAKMIWKP